MFSYYFDLEIKKRHILDLIFPMVSSLKTKAKAAKNAKKKNKSKNPGKHNNLD